MRRPATRSVRHVVDIGDRRNGHVTYLGPAAIEAIVAHSASDPDLVLSSMRHEEQDRRSRTILRLRGIECRPPDGVAEGLICRKLVV